MLASLHPISFSTSSSDAIDTDKNQTNAKVEGKPNATEISGHYPESSVNDKTNPICNEGKKQDSDPCSTSLMSFFQTALGTALKRTSLSKPQPPI